MVALYLYRFGIPSLGDPAEIGDLLGMGASSLVARLSNYLAVATGGQYGLPNYPPDDEVTYKRYGVLERRDLEEMARAYLEEMRHRKAASDEAAAGKHEAM